MRKFYSLLPFFFFCFFSSNTFAQQDTSLKAKIRDLIRNEPSVKNLNADSISIKSGNFYVFFNTGQSFIKGELKESETETLMELLAPFTTETATSNVFLLAKERSTGEWKTLDYFIMAPVPDAPKQMKNLDAYPDIQGKGTTAARVFPGSGQPVAGGALTGKTVWLSPGHGWHNIGSGFTTQRGTTNSIVEDFTTAESMDYYLMHYLTNAGANVWSVRERDVNTNEIIVNNDQGAPSYTETGTWTDGSIPGYNGSYRTTAAGTAESATATFVPNVTTSGLYWVSVRFVSGTNRSSDVLYKVTHAGGTTTFKVNQEVHGNTWNYLGQFYFIAGGKYAVTISNQSSEAGQAIVADAIRLGGGVGGDPDCLNGGAPSGKPRFEESARQYARFQGNPACREDVTVRPTYAEWELQKGASQELSNSVFVSFHTNAGGGTGTETYRYNGLGSSQPTITQGSTQLRDSIHKQLVADIRSGWRANWSDRGVKEANFGELRELRIMPGTLIELAFHDHVGDAAELRNPEFRRLAARAIYKGIVKYFHYKNGTPIIFLPEEPRQVAARNMGNAKIAISWAAPVSGGIFGHPATSYRLYISENGRGFANPVEVNGTSYTFTGQANKTYFFKVAAVNDGGESFASGVVAARTPGGSTPVKFLIVDGFDRLDASAMILKNEGGALGNVRRMFLERMNNYNYMVEHGKGLASCDLSFDGIQNEVVGAGNINLAQYYAVDWFVGEESTTDKTLDDTERQKLKDYLNEGGRLLLSGSEIAWDLGRSTSANADLSFFNDYLKAVYVGDGAGTYNFSGTSSFFTGSSGTFSNGFNGYYNVDFPDRLDTIQGSKHVLNYVGGTADGAGIGYRGNYNLLYFGFPVEAVTEEGVRNTLICQSASFLAADIYKPTSELLLTGRAEGSINLLRWITLSENNIAYYILERSSDGVNFQSFGGRITAVGSPTVGSTYDAIDIDFFPITYYRVKVVTVNGREMFSNIAIIQNNKQKLLYSIVENPAKSVVRLRTNVDGKITVVLKDSQGQAVYQALRQTNHGGEIVIPVGNLPRGVYWLFVYSNGYVVKTFQIILQ